MNMADLKREYVVPLRRKIRTAPKWRRSKKAVSVLKEFVRKHMKTEDVIVCPELNEYLWANGSKNPPGKVSVITLKRDINGVNRTLVNLSNVGLDKYLHAYSATAQEEVPKTKKEAKADLESEIQEAEVKEVKEETKKAPTKAKKASSAKKEESKK